MARQSARRITASRSLVGRANCNSRTATDLPRSRGTSSAGRMTGRRLLSSRNVRSRSRGVNRLHVRWSTKGRSSRARSDHHPPHQRRAPPLIRRRARKPPARPPSNSSAPPSARAARSIHAARPGSSRSALHASVDAHPERHEAFRRRSLELAAHEPDLSAAEPEVPAIADQHLVARAQRKSRASSYGEARWRRRGIR